MGGLMAMNTTTNNVNEYIRGQLYRIIYLEDRHMEFQREADVLRGALGALLYMDKISVASYAFFINFVRWMEDDFCGFSWEQKQRNESFFEELYAEMEGAGWFDEAEEY